MSKLVQDKERCKACGICIRGCPKEAIELTSERNSKGYKTIKVDLEKCIYCGTCYWVCPDWVIELEV